MLEVADLIIPGGCQRTLTAGAHAIISRQQSGPSLGGHHRTRRALQDILQFGVGWTVVLVINFSDVQGIAYCKVKG